MGSREPQSVQGQDEPVLIPSSDLEGQYASVVLSLAQTEVYPTLEGITRPDEALNSVNLWISEVQTKFVDISNRLKGSLAARVSEANPIIRTAESDKKIVKALKDFVESIFESARKIPKGRFPDLQNQNKSLQSEVQRLKEESQKNELALSKNESDLASATSEVKILKSQISDLQSRLEQCSNSGSQKSSDFEACENEKARLKQEYDECSKAVQLLKSKVASNKQTIANLESEKETISKEKATLTETTTKTIKKLEKELKKLRNTEQTCKSSHDTLEQDIKSFTDKISKLSSDLSESNRKNEELQAKIRTINPPKKISSPSAPPSLTADDIENLEIVKELRRQNQELSEQIEECNRSCKAVSEHVDELNEKINQHQEDEANTKQELQEKEEKIQKLEEEVEKQKKKKDKLSKTLEEVVTNVRINSPKVVPDTPIQPSNGKPSSVPPVKEEEDEGEASNPAWKLEKITSQQCSNMKECIGKFVEVPPKKKLGQIPSEIVFTINNPPKSVLESLKMSLDDNFATPVILNLTPNSEQSFMLAKLYVSLQPTSGNTRVSSIKSDASKIEVMINTIDFSPSPLEDVLPIIKFSRKLKDSDGTEAQSIALNIDQWKTISGDAAVSPQGALGEETDEENIPESKQTSDEDNEDDGSLDFGGNDTDENDAGKQSSKKNLKGEIPGKTDFRLLNDKTFQVLFTVPDIWKSTKEYLSTISAQIKGINKPKISVCNDDVLQDLLSPYMMDLGQGLLPGVQVVVTFHAYDKSSKDHSPDETLIKLEPESLNEISDRIDIHVYLCAKPGITVFDEDHSFIFELTIQGTKNTQYSYNAFTSSARTEMTPQKNSGPESPKVITKSFPPLTIDQI